MDLNSLVSTMLSGDSLDNIGKVTGSSNADVKSVLGSALPLLLNGVSEQSQGEDTAAGFAQALASHSKDDTSNIASFLGGVDLADGAKIVGHLLGAKTQDTTKDIATKSGLSLGTTANIIAAIAPLLMSLLGKQTNAAQQQNSSLNVGSIIGTLLGGADLGSLVSGILGGGAAAPAPEPVVQQIEEEKPLSGFGKIAEFFTNLLK
ncbi:MAG: DUF937 domain-containing protein [Lachnospiraceae bacterium]|nr:DUF937 domain-containing protein [Lachnospiraceae bacterium]